MAWWSFAAAHGMTESARLAVVEEVAGDFRTTPLTVFSLDLGPDGEGGATPVWVKDETGNVAGSHKARHLAGILLHLRAAEVLGVAPPGGSAATGHRVVRQRRPGRGHPGSACGVAARRLRPHVGVADGAGRPRGRRGDGHHLPTPRR